MYELWCSAPSSLNNDLLNDGVILDMYSRLVNIAIEMSFRFLFGISTNAKIVLLGGSKIYVGDVSGWDLGEMQETESLSVTVWFQGASMEEDRRPLVHLTTGKEAETGLRC